LPGPIAAADGLPGTHVGCATLRWPMDDKTLQLWRQIEGARRARLAAGPAKAGKTPEHVAANDPR